MKTEKFIFTVLPTIASCAGLIGFHLGYYWVTLVASFFCLPVIFYRFVVETNFLFTVSVIPLTILGSLVHESWYGGAAIWFLGWTLISVVHSYVKYTPIKRQCKRERAAYKQSSKFKLSIEKEKAAYNFDISVLSTKTHHIKFKKAIAAIAEPVTKFGGQPVWLDSPQWPVSKSTGKPMQFIGQIEINETLYGPSIAKMAYIFYAGEETESWEMDSGDNAIILQPGKAKVASLPLFEGPTVTGINKEPCEYSVLLHSHEDSQFIPEFEQRTWEEMEGLQYEKVNYKTKLGGTPYFIKADNFPVPGRWQLLLQLKGHDLPFDVDFSLGCAYVFINTDGADAKFIWQS